MPADITTAHSPVEVYDWDGTGFPFSKGLMATSILATGLETDRAYAIAAEIQSDLVARRVNRVSGGELMELVAANLEEHAGIDYAARYRAWHAVKNSGRPLMIALGGVPGVGKSTLATRLAVRLGINHLVTTDTIREVLRTVIPEAVLPELHTSTYESVRVGLPGEPQSLSFHRQAQAVGSATAAVLRRLATEQRSAILDGVHLFPGRLREEIADHPSRPIVAETLLVLSDEDRHRRHLNHRVHGEPTRGGERHLRQFDTIRRLQEMLRSLAQQAGVAEYDVVTTDRLTQQIVDQIVALAGIASPVPEVRP